MASGSARATAASQHPPLPWLARPDYTTLRDTLELAQYLTEMNAAIAGRVGELREQPAGRLQGQ